VQLCVLFYLLCSGKSEAARADAVSILAGRMSVPVGDMNAPAEPNGKMAT